METIIEFLSNLTTPTLEKIADSLKAEIETGHKPQELDLYLEIKWNILPIRYTAGQQ